jgi:uncharacterized RDD family membrane protein YckC
MATSELALAPPVYAGFWRRLGACLFDGLLLAVPVLVFTLVAVIAWKATSSRSSSDVRLLAVPVAWLLALVFAIWLYFAVSESSSRQATVGKRVFGIYVTDVDGRRLTLGRSTCRILAKYISSLTLGIGYLLCGFTPKKQALHDLITNSLVLRRMPQVADTESKILARELGRLAGFGAFGARWAARRLPNIPCETQIELDETTAAVAKRVESVLTKIGKPIPELKSDVNLGVFYAVVGSGHLNLNPTIVHICLRSFEENTFVSIRAVAKEGLVKQHSAQLAIERVRASLLGERVQHSGASTTE